jgi:hypothetical protein
MTDQQRTFKVWASDQQIYGPISLQTLEIWAEERRIDCQTWIFSSDTQKWMHANKVEGLSELLSRESAAVAEDTGMISHGHASEFVKADDLRSFDALVGMGKNDLDTLIRCCEVVTMCSGNHLCHKSDPADCMFFIIQGQLNAVIPSAVGEEEVLGQICEGQFVGEMSIFSQGERSADVVAITDATLLKIDITHLNAMIDKHPNLAARFLLSVGRNLTQRIIQMNDHQVARKKADFIWR